MTDATLKEKRRAWRAAAITVAFVALFAVAFAGTISMLNDLADDMYAEKEIAIGSEAPTEPFYVVLIGNDSRRGTAMYNGKSGTDSDSRADIITLMRIDPVEYKISLVSIPRDTVIDGHTSKINDALLSNDPQDVVNAVEELTDIRADYYMMTSFISFENLVNALGGVDVDVPKNVTVSDPATGKKVTVKAGKNQHLDGSKALVLARARQEYGDNNQEALRQVNVRNIEMALIKKILDMDGSVDMEHVLAALENDTKTNLDLSNMGLLMLDFVEHADEVTFYSGTGPYNGFNRSTDGTWVVPDDEETWIRIVEALNAGEDPAEVLQPPKF